MYFEDGRGAWSNSIVGAFRQLWSASVGGAGLDYASFLDMGIVHSLIEASYRNDIEKYDQLEALFK